eukprot:PhF_6_TR3756/c0_g1_i1/m.5426/K05657/ABCB10; ATP-binding cassette, subfamily B (MDR/TAP), member 10
MIRRFLCRKHVPNIFLGTASYVTTPRSSSSALTEAGAAQPPAPRPLSHPDIITPTDSRPEGIGLYVVQPRPPEGSDSYWNRYVGLARPHWLALAASTLCLVAYSASTLAIPHFFGHLIDCATNGDMPVNTAAILLALFSAAGVTNFCRLALVGRAGEKIIHDLRVRVFRALVHKRCDFFDKSENMTGGLSQRVSSDSSFVGMTLSEALSNGTKNVCQMIGSLCIMLYLSPPLTGVIVVMLPPLAIIAGTYGRFVRKLTAQRSHALVSMASTATERISHIQTVKAFANENLEVRLFEKNSNKVLSMAYRMVHWNAAYTACLHVSGYFTLYGLIYAGSMLVASHDLTGGSLFSFILYTVYCGLGIVGTVNFANEMNKGFGASLGLFKILDEAGEVERPAAASKEMVMAKSPLGGSQIDIAGVTFAYPTRKESLVYHNVSFTIRPGLCTALVGSSGSGKSTLAKLLLKLYGDYEGTITMDGVDIRNFDDKLLRGRIGYVPQEPVLFNGTISQNIAYGISGRNWEDPIDTWLLSAIQDAATQSNAHEFIMALPEGYDTLVGESGKSLSGGQKQRIAIARALIKNPGLLILDEATSALDRESEKIVQASIDKIIGNARSQKQRAVLVITHRVSMMKAADYIVLLENGKVLGEGKQEDMVTRPEFKRVLGDFDSDDE